MKKLNELFISFKKKPYKLISLLTIMVFVVGISAFSIIKSNQVKGYSGLPYNSTDYGSERYHLMGLVDINGNKTRTGTTDEDYFADIEQHQLVDAEAKDLKGITKLSIPYRYASGGQSDEGYSIDGQYGFLPKWTEGKSKVFLYKKGIQSTGTDIVTLNDGTKETEKATTTTPSPTAYTFTSEDVDNGAFMKFTYMGQYKNEWIDVVVKPVSIDKKDNSSLSVGYGKTASVTEVEPGSYLALSNTSLNVDRTKAPTFNSAHGAPDASTSTTNSTKDSTKGPNVNYVEVDYKFYKTIIDSDAGADEGKDMRTQKQTAVQGFFTFSDFDYNESIGLDSKQINQLFVVKPNEEDNGYMTVDQNPGIYGYQANNTAYRPVGLEGFDATKYYTKPDELKAGDTNTLFYLFQRYGVLNSAYTQLMYTYYDKESLASTSKDKSFVNGDFIFFNRGYQANTDVNAKGAWLSFTYKETSDLHLSINASKSFSVSNYNVAGSRNINITTDMKNKKSGFWSDFNTTKTDLATQYNYTFDREAQDFYVIAKIWGQLNFKPTISISNPSIINWGADAYSFLPYLSATATNASASGNTTSNQTGSAIGYTAKTMIPILPNSPIKTAEVVSGSDNMEVKWKVIQNIPVQFKQKGATGGALTIEDQVPEYLSVLNGSAGIKITDLSGVKDASYLFETPYYDSNTNKITFKATAESTSGQNDFYQNSYIISYSTYVDQTIFTDPSKTELLSKFNEAYYQRVGQVENIDGTKTDVANSYVFYNQAKLITQNIYFESYDLYSTPEYSNETIDWKKVLQDNNNEMPLKYKTPAIIPLNTSITITKTGETSNGNTPLGGAGFNVYTENDKNEKVYILDSSGNKALFTTDATTGKVVIKDNYEMVKGTLVNVGITNGTYYFEEVNVPKGYEAPDTPPSYTVEKFGEHAFTINNNKTRTIGDLNVTKEVFNSDGSAVDKDVVRGTELYYVVTLQNTSDNLTKIDDLVMSDELPTDYLDFDFTTNKISVSTVEAIGASGTTFEEVEYDGVKVKYDSVKGLVVSGLGVSLGDGQQIKIKIPVKIKYNAEAGPFTNTAVGEGKGFDNDLNEVSTGKKEASVVVNVEPFPTGDLQIEKGVSQTNNGTNYNDWDNKQVVRGEKLYYTIIVKNGTNPDDKKSSLLTNIKIEDVLSYTDKISVDSANIKATGVEASGTTDTSNYTTDLKPFFNGGTLSFNSNLSLREGEQIRVLIPVTVLERATPGEFKNSATVVSSEVTTPVQSNEVINSVPGYPTGKLELIKQVSDNINPTGDRDNINGKTVDRGDTLYYTITVKNSSTTTSLIENVVIEDTFNLSNVSVINSNSIKISKVEKISSNITDPSSIDQDLPTGSSLDANGKLTISGVSLEEGEQHRILIPVKINDNVSSDVKEITNMAIGKIGSEPDVNSNTVVNPLSELDKELYIRQIVVNQNDKLVVPTKGNFKIENVSTSGNKGSGVSSNITVNSGTKADYKKIIIPYSSTNTSYYFDVILPEMYQVAKGYTVETSDANVDYSTSEDLSKQFEYSGNGPFYVTIYIEPKFASNKVIPFYNWSYKDNLFGKIKK